MFFVMIFGIRARQTQNEIWNFKTSLTENSETIANFRFPCYLKREFKEVQSITNQFCAHKRTEHLRCPTRVPERMSTSIFQGSLTRA